MPKTQGRQGSKTQEGQSWRATLHVRRKCWHKVMSLRVTQANRRNDDNNKVVTQILHCILAQRRHNRRLIQVNEGQ